MHVCMCVYVGIRKIHNKLIRGFSVFELFKILNNYITR